MFGCSSSLQKQATKLISETRENFYFSENETCFASLTFGDREQDYILNGEHTPNIAYGVVCVKFKFAYAESKLPRFELSINDKFFYGEFEFNPFNKTFVFDICEKFNDNANIDLYLVDFDCHLNLTNLTNTWKIKCADAFEIFVKNEARILKQSIKNKTLEGEFFIKIISEIPNTTQNLCWYVCFMTVQGEVIYNIIDVNTGEILAR